MALVSLYIFHIVVFLSISQSLSHTNIFTASLPDMSSRDMVFPIEVIDNVVVGVEEPWNNHWLPFTNLDLIVPPFEIGSFLCFKKPSNGSFSTIVNTLKASLSRALTVYYPLAGDIIWNQAVEEKQIRCNYQGVNFVTAVADVQLKELNFYNPNNEGIEAKLMPKKPRGVFAVQVMFYN